MYPDGNPTFDDPLPWVFAPLQWDSAGSGGSSCNGGGDNGGGDGGGGGGGGGGNDGGDACTAFCCTGDSGALPNAGPGNGPGSPAGYMGGPVIWQGTATPFCSFPPGPPPSPGP